MNGYVPGIRDILDGYTKPDGTQEPSLDEKIERGRAAIAALADFRNAGAMTDTATLNSTLSTLNSNIPYFGYGYVQDRAQVVPYIPVCFYAFRVMVGGGCLFILLFLIILWKPKTWVYWVSLFCIPISYIVSEAGWLVAEFGRQPWTIQDMLPTWAGVRLYTWSFDFAQPCVFVKQLPGPILCASFNMRTLSPEVTGSFCLIP